MWTAKARQRYSWTRRREGVRLTDLEWALLALARTREARAPMEIHVAHDHGCDPSPLANGLLLERTARLGAATQHRLRVVPAPIGRQPVAAACRTSAEG